MRNRGFTAIEILMVMIIIGVLAAFGIPRLRNSLEKQNVRSAKALFATLVATARGVAVSRGCPATLTMTVDSAWVTACGVSPPAASVQVGTKKLIGDDFNVKLGPSVSSLIYDPRGISTAYQVVTVQVIGTTVTDSVIINQVGKVVRQ
jgi:prepilin-type N-terminal cleavage/methylation domain-containing protein